MSCRATLRPDIPSTSTCERFTLLGVEIEFNGSAGEVPGDVLASDEVMAERMVEGVRLHESSIRLDHPFEGLQAIVGGTALKARLMRRKT